MRPSSLTADSCSKRAWPPTVAVEPGATLGRCPGLVARRRTATPRAMRRETFVAQFKGVYFVGPHPVHRGVAESSLTSPASSNQSFRPNGIVASYSRERGAGDKTAPTRHVFGRDIRPRGRNLVWIARPRPWAIPRPCPPTHVDDQRGIAGPVALERCRRSQQPGSRAGTADIVSPDASAAGPGGLQAMGTRRWCSRASIITTGVGAAGGGGGGAGVSAPPTVAT